MTHELLTFTEPNFFDISSFSILAFSLFPVENVNAGIFSRITMTGMTSQWYLRLSHFEALLVGLVVLQVFVMRYLLILPLDITKLIDDGTLLATSVSRKRRHAISYAAAIKHQRLAESMFTVIRRLDENDCVLRTLCELEFHANDKENISVSGAISDLLGNLKRLGYQRVRDETMRSPNNRTIQERKVLAEFEDAVLFGAGDNTLICENHSNSNNPNEACGLQYSLCTADKSELFDYVKKIEPFLIK